MKRVLAILPICALGLAACGSSDEVSIDNAWARATAEGQANGAIYFDLTVDADDTLLAADVPTSVAGEAEVHEVVMADMDDGEMSETDDGEMSETDDGEMSETDDDGEMSETDDGEMSEMDDDGEMSGSDDMDDMDDMDGAMVMQELTAGLPLTGGETVTFEPGGYHIMLLGLAEPLEVGDEVELTLEFAEAGETTLTVEVAESAP